MTIAGLALTILGAVGYLLVAIELGPRFPWLRNHAAPSLVVVAVGLVLAAVGVARARRRLGPGVLLAATIALGAAFAAFLWVVTAVPPVPGPPVGTPAPAFALADQTGRPVRLEDFRGKPLLLVFYRGHW